MGEDQAVLAQLWRTLVLSIWLEKTFSACMTGSALPKHCNMAPAFFISTMTSRRCQAKSSKIVANTALRLCFPSQMQKTHLYLIHKCCIQTTSWKKKQQIEDYLPGRKVYWNIVLDFPNTLFLSHPLPSLFSLLTLSGLHMVKAVACILRSNKTHSLSIISDEKV